jgi:arylsulfatase A-like enzyme
MMGLAHRGWSLNNYEEHILHTLRKSGYSTTLAGLQHIATDARTVGFDTILQSGIPARSEPGGVDGDSFQAQRVAPSAAKFIESHPRQPFFLDVGFFETHRPFHQAVDNFAYILPPSPVPDVPDTRADMAGFHASASAMDAGVGMVLDALAAAGLEENTLVISTTDHGISFPDMKCSLKDAGTGVSMIMRGPGIFSEAAVCDAMLSQVDVFPTICDYLGIEKPQWLQGRSFLPVLEKKRDEVNEAIFAEVTYHAAYEPKRSVRTRTLKYIRHFDDRTRAVLPNCDDGPSKSYWMKHGWKTRLTTREELYDLIFDPNENNNLVNEPRMAADLTDLRSRLDRWMTETRDPLLKGPVLPPPDGRVTSPDVDSPGGLLVFAPPPL